MIHDDAFVKLKAKAIRSAEECQIIIWFVLGDLGRDTTSRIVNKSGLR